MATHTLHRLLPLALTVAFAGSLRGQEPSHRAPAADPASPAQRPVVTVSIAFRGGTLYEYLEALRGTGDHNIVIPDKARSVTVQPLTLKSVSLGNAIEVVAKTADRDRFHVSLSVLAGTGTPVYAVHVEERSRNSGGQSQGAGIVNVTRAFSLHNLTTAPTVFEGIPGLTLSADTVLAAVRIGLEVATKGGDLPAPTLKFHEDSGLLFLNGHATCADVVQSVIRELESAMNQKRMQTQPQALRPNPKTQDTKPQDQKQVEGR